MLNRCVAAAVCSQAPPLPLTGSGRVHQSGALRATNQGRIAPGSPPAPAVPLGPPSAAAGLQSAVWGLLRDLARAWRAWQPFREGSPGDQPAALRLFAPSWPLPAHFPRASVKPSSSPWRLSTCALRRPLGEAPGWGTRSRSPGRARRAAPAPRGPRTARKRHPLTPTTHPGTPIGECARRVLQVGVAPGRVPRSGSPPPGRQRLEQRPAAGGVPRAVAGRLSAQRARAGVAAAAGRALGLGARRIGPPQAPAPGPGR